MKNASLPVHKKTHQGYPQKRAGVWFRECKGPIHNGNYVPLDEFSKSKNGQWRIWCNDCIAYAPYPKRIRAVKDPMSEEWWISATSDPLVVLTSDLAKVLKEWVAKHRRRFPRDPGLGVYGTAIQSFGAINYIAQETGLIERRITGIIRCESEHTTYRVADAILTAIERTDLFHTDVIPIPNPRWTKERWDEYRKQHGFCEP